MEYPDGQTREQWLEASRKGLVDHPFYKQPPPEQRIWRYMDFAKFVSLLEDRALYLPAASQFDDQLEGSVSIVNVQLRKEFVVKATADAKTAGVFTPVIDASEIAKGLTRTLKVFSDRLRWAKKWTFVSCWHANEHESAAMWKLYAASNQAIAIESSIGRLSECLDAHREPPQGDPILASVYYIDYSTEPVKTNYYLSQYLYKRKSFEHEREIRAVMQRLPLVPATHDSEGRVASHHDDMNKESPPGLQLAIDPSVLIVGVHIAPDAPGWLISLTKKVLERYGVRAPVQQSSLLAEPLF